MSTPLTDPPAAAPAPAAPAPRELAVRFAGSAREYFRIWAVNLCLTLLTLGVFSAWAKVRRKRYFYSHTTVDGTPFRYLGRPLPILRGRIVAVALFLLYYASEQFFTTLLPYVLAAGALLAPWVVVRSAAFNARYSAYRNLTFRFDGGYRDAFLVIHWLGLVPLLVAGTIFDWWGMWYLAVAAYALFALSFPWWLRRLKALLVGRSAFGGRHGEFGARGGQFLRIYFIAAVIVVAAALVTGVVAMLMFGFAKMKPTQHAALLLTLPVYAGYVVAFAYVQAQGSNLVWNHSRLGPLRFRSTLTGRGLTRLYLTNALAILASLGLLTPWAVVRTLRYRADHMQVLLDGALEEFRAEGAGAVAAAGGEVGELFDVDLSL
jgi:uncharacterized membrane protein YjgN (DUF898 family)